MTRLVLDLVRPYRGWLLIVFLAMLVETAMSLAGPWPLKVVIDNVLGGHRLPEWLRSLDDSALAQSKMGLAAVAAIALIVIAAVGALATYIDNYYTESVGQWVAARSARKNLRPSATPFARVLRQAADRRAAIDDHQ